VDLSNSPETTLRDFLFQISPKGTGKGSRVDSLNLAEYDPTEPEEDAFDHPAAPEQSEDFFAKSCAQTLRYPAKANCSLNASSSVALMFPCYFRRNISGIPKQIECVSSVF
jgi:hypothetical protein